ncbi:SagB/ThcOx family dehydrogenase [Chlamydiota bacterium]
MESKKFILPKPSFTGKMSVEECIVRRRSRRRFAENYLSLEEISQLLWAGQGITHSNGLRTVPSAGATFPLKTYLLVGAVQGIGQGLYQYDIEKHGLSLMKSGDFRVELMSACWGQTMIGDAPVSLIFTALYERTCNRYGKRGIRYVHMEVGHVGQNIHLQAESLALGTVVIGAFDDMKVKAVLGIEDEVPLYIMPVGKRE